MAASASVAYHILTAGNDLNGGGFDASVSSPGTDYSQNTSPQVTFNGTTVTATTAAAGATITLSGYTVATTDNGNSVNIASGTNFTAGVYTITAVSVGSNTWTLDRNCTTAAGSALVARMGGGWATPKGNFASASNWMGNGCTIWLQGAGTNNPSAVDYVTTGFVTAANGSTSSGRINFIGYNGRPHISSDGLLHWQNAGWRYENLKVSMTGTSNNSANGVFGSGGNNVFENIIFDQKNLDAKLSTSVAGTVYVGCAAYSSIAISGGAGTNAAFDISGNYNARAIGCVALGVKGIGFNMDGGAIAAFCLAANCNSDGFKVIGTRSDMGATLINCTDDANLGHGVNLTSDNAVSFTTIINHNVSNHVTASKYGIFAGNSRTAAVNDVLKGYIKSNNLYNNNGASGGGYQNLSTTQVDGVNADFNLDPQYTNTSGGDYSIGTNLKAKGLPAAFPISGIIATTGYTDIGAVQRQEAGSGGGMLVHPGMGGGARG